MNASYKGREFEILKQWGKENLEKLSKLKCLTEQREIFKPGQTQANSAVTLIAEINQNSGHDASENNGEYFYNVDCIVTHFFVKDNITYMACKECRKKVIRDISSGDWRCDRCNKTYDDADATYMLLV